MIVNGAENNLQIFNYEERDVRVIMRDGEPWWVLRDVCDILGISNYRDTAARLDDDERGSVRVDTLGGEQEMAAVNESGLYNVIIRSDKPNARKFRKWITSEVLPSIRKHGLYATESVIDSIIANPDLGIKLFTELKQERMRVREEQTKNKALIQYNTQLENKIQEDSAAVSFVEQAVKIDGKPILVGQLAKILSDKGFRISTHGMFEVLRREEYLYHIRTNQRNMPTEKSLDANLITYKVTDQEDGKGYTTPYVTPEGQIYFVDKYTKEGSEVDLRASVYLSVNAISRYIKNNPDLETGVHDGRQVYFISTHVFDQIVVTQDCVIKQNLSNLRVALNKYGYTYAHKLRKGQVLKRNLSKKSHQKYPLYMVFFKDTLSKVT